MKKFVRIVCLLTVLSIVAGLFVGCGNKVNDKDEQGRTMISVSNWPTKKGIDLDAANRKKARFEEANPDVVVEGSPWTFDRKTFYAKAAGGQLPVLYNTGVTELPEIIDSGYSADLTEVLKERGYEGMFDEKILAVISDEDGKIRAFPNSAYLMGLWYNVELFEKAGLMEADGTPKQPKDWYEVAEFAVKIKEATGTAGVMFPSANNLGGWIFTPVAWSFGVEFMEKDADGKWKATFDTPEAVEALQYIKDLKWKYDVLPTNTLIDATEYQKTFATGKAGMIIAAPNWAQFFVQYGTNAEQIGMMAMPAGPKRNVTLLGGGVYLVREDATKDQIDAAIRWIETSKSFKLTEEFKTNNTKMIGKYASDGQLVGIKGMSVWSKNSEARNWELNLIDEMANANPNHVRLYNEYVENCPAEIQAEEPVCAQELYGILDGCIQEVLVNKDADCAELIKKAVSDFQANYLDNLTY